MPDRKTLMVLGAGLYQIPLIRRIGDLGHRVITVDNIPDNIGHKISDASFDISTTDVDGVLRAAREASIDGLLTYGSDVAVPTVAAVTSELGLNGPPVHVATIMTDKGEFRAFQNRQGLPAPPYFTCDNEEQGLDGLHRLPRPLVVKPVDTSGSRGISLISPADGDARARAAISAALAYSRTGTACIEGLVEGTHASADVFMIGGAIVGGGTTRKYMKDFAVLGHEMPSHISPDWEERIKSEVERTCRLIGYSEGPLDIDVVFSGTRVVIIEISPRLGGNGIPELVEAATELELITTTIRYALGERQAAVTLRPRTGTYGSVILKSDKQGVLKDIASPESVRIRMPELIHLYYGVQPGDQISAFEHGGNSLGYGLFAIPRDATHPDMARRVAEAIDLQVIPSKSS